jgi:hypothetical protein
MKISAILSTLTTTVCVVLSVWLFVLSRSNAALQADLQEEQQEYQIRAGKLREQEARINAGMQLAQQVGPAVLRDLGALSLQNNNEKIKQLLAKYGVEVKQSEPPAPQP